MGRVARIRHDARRSMGAQGVRDVEAAIRHLQYAIARHLRNRPLLAIPPHVFEWAAAAPGRQRAPRARFAWSSEKTSGRDL